MYFVLKCMTLPWLIYSRLPMSLLLSAVCHGWYLDRRILGEFCLFVFVALRPMSTAMVIAGRSVYLTTLFPGQA